MLTSMVMPLTAADLIARAEASNQDIQADNVHDLEEVMKEDWDWWKFNSLLALEEEYLKPLRQGQEKMKPWLLI